GSKNIDEMIAAAKQWHATEAFDGVITFSEAAVVAVAAIAEALGLPGIGVEAALNSRNKYLMRQAHEKAGAPIPGFRFVTTLDEARSAADAFGYPVIVKPTLGAGSHFVFRCDDETELTERY
ncbi:carboxylate--amine ligase, partial [Saccharothrix sp. NRRL B-16348]|uniref:ATP-grasp domain-containing protein n=1 Tax=Saccharothrix sp. NRRL B-16348 TaxID=1415542 RepID=UPI0006C638A8